MFASKTIKTARRIHNAADAGGTIQASDMVRLSSDPSDHTTMSIRDAFRRVLGVTGERADDLLECCWE